MQQSFLGLERLRNSAPFYIIIRAKRTYKTLKEKLHSSISPGVRSPSFISALRYWSFSNNMWNFLQFWSSLGVLKMDPSMYIFMHTFRQGWKRWNKTVNVAWICCSKKTAQTTMCTCSLNKSRKERQKQLFGLLTSPSSPRPVVFSEAMNLTSVKLYLYLLFLFSPSSSSVMFSWPQHTQIWQIRTRDWYLWSWCSLFNELLFLLCLMEMWRQQQLSLPPNRCP